MSEKLRLEAEIKYYSDLLKNSRQNVQNHTNSNPYKYKKMSDQSGHVIKKTTVKTEPVHVKNSEVCVQKNTVISNKNTSNRVVLPPQNSKRIVLASTAKQPAQNPIQSTSSHRNTQNFKHPTNISYSTSEYSSKYSKTSSTQYQKERPQPANELLSSMRSSRSSFKYAHEQNSKHSTGANPYKWVKKENLPKNSQSDEVDSVHHETKLTMKSPSHSSSLSQNSQTITHSSRQKRRNCERKKSNVTTSDPVTQSVTSGDKSLDDKLVRKGKYKLIKSSIIEKQKTARKVKSELLKTNRKGRRLSDERRRLNAPRRKSSDSKIKSTQNKIISRYKIRRRSKNSSPQRTPPHNHNFKVINHLKFQHSSPYKSRKHPTTVNSRFKIDRRGQTNLRRSKFHTKSSPYTWVRGTRSPRNKISAFVSPYKLVRRTSIESGVATPKSDYKSNFVRQLASRVLQRSAVTSLRVKYRKNNTNDKQCLFYMRFGVCKRGNSCRFEHNPHRIAVCTRYLRGTCTIENCKFSHEAHKEKVPVCQHFLRGVCARDNCPYLHVNVGRDAPICQNFAKYKYCHLGEKCRKLHTDICPNRTNKGDCPRGKNCHLRHPVRVKKSRPPHKLPVTELKSDPVIPNNEKFSSPLPSYISLRHRKSSESAETGGFISGAKKLKIKPSFLD